MGNAFAGCDGARQGADHSPAFGMLCRRPIDRPIVVKFDAKDLYCANKRSRRKEEEEGDYSTFLRFLAVSRACCNWHLPSLPTIERFRFTWHLSRLALKHHCPTVPSFSNE